MPAAASHVSPFSGSWYPADPFELRELLDRVFSESAQRTGRFLPQKAWGFVVPHAGLVYSGTVAAAAYRHLEDPPPERVILLGFAHRGAAPGVWIPELEAIGTPLGEVAIDRDAADALRSGGEFRALPEAALCDHSVEIQLPLLQHACPNARVVPVYVSQPDPEARAAAARRLAGLAGPGTVFLASSDFTHFGRSFGYQPFPVDDWVADRLRELDDAVIQAASSLHPNLFLEALQATSSTVCGYEPIALLLATLKLLDQREEIFQDMLDYQTSGEITGDFHHSVSYAALGYFPFQAFGLGEEDRRLLLESARTTLQAYLDTGRRRLVPPAHLTPGLDRRAAAFVTLHRHGELRGCVGRRAAGEPLSETVPAMTLAAALEDTRFHPVAPGETGLELEISVLSPMKRIPDQAGFRVNDHGAMLEAGPHHGLLLPQVATERDWTAAQFLDALARKAGVGRDVYRDPDTRISVFRAQILK